MGTAQSLLKKEAKNYTVKETEILESLDEVSVERTFLSPQVRRVGITHGNIRQETKHSESDIQTKHYKSDKVTSGRRQNNQNQTFRQSITNETR